MFLGRKRKTDVQILKSTLIATFASANPPLIWKFDLARNHSFTLALQGDTEGMREEGDWELGVTSPKGEFFPIAHFLSRDDADEAFFKLQKALTASQKPLFRKILRIVFLAVLAFFGLIVLIDILRTMSMHMVIEENQRILTQSAPPAPMEMKNGIPQSADDVLTPPR